MPHRPDWQLRTELHVTAPSTDVPALFQPFVLRELTFSNRVMVTPMCQYVADDGHVVDWHFAHHGRFALGGVGAAMVESTGVTRNPWNPEFTPGGSSGGSARVSHNRATRASGCGAT